MIKKYGNWLIAAVALLVGVAQQAQATTCGSAISLSPGSLPIVGQALVCGGTNDLSSTTVPATCGGASNSYKDGQEALYTLVPTVTGSYTINIAGQTWTAIFVYNGCPTSGGVCVGSIGTFSSSKSIPVTLTAGNTYYIWFDTWPTPNSPCPGTFGITAPGAPPRPCVDCTPTDAALGVIGTTVYGYSSVGNAGNGGKWVASFTGEAGAIYHFDLCPSSPGSGTASYDADIKILNSTCTILTGADGSGCVGGGSAYLVNDYTWTCPSNGTYYVTVAPYSSYGSHTCTGTAANTHTLAYYKQLPVARPCVDCTPTDAALGVIGTTVYGYSSVGNAGNGGKWVASFTGEAGAIYHFDLCPSSPGSGTASYDADIKILNSTCTILTGADGSGCVGGGSAYLVNDYTWTCPSNGTYYVTVAPYSSYASHTCTGTAANTHTLAYYKQLLPPPNDACSAAITIACTPTPVGGTTVNSTMDAEYTDCGAGAPGLSGQNGVWYKIIGDNNQYTITTCDPGGLGYDTRLTVYSGSCGALSCVTGNDDMTPACTTGSFRSRVNFPANLGTDYYVFVHGYGSPSATGTFNLHITCTPLCLPTPPNDLCSTATTLVVDAAATSDDNLCANVTPGNPTCESGFATLPDVWYGFTASAGGTNLLVINLGTATSMGYAVYSATCGGSQVFCNASVTSGATNTLTGLTPGGLYYIRVETDELTTGTFDIRVSSPCQPAATPTVVPDCGSNQFTIDVNVTNMGTASTVTVATDYVGDTEPSVSSTGVVTIGPYPSGTSVVITLEHDSDPLCDATLAAVSYTCPPPNDLCANAIAVACNSMTAGSTISSTVEAPVPPFCGTSITTAGVWYTVVGTGGTITASLCTALAYDTKIGVYTTPDCVAYTCVTGNDDYCVLGSQVSWLSTLGTTYHILVHGFLGQTGPFVLEVVCGGNDVPPCMDNEIELELQTDTYGTETGWEIIPFGNSLPVCSNLAYTYPGNSTIIESCCLIDGCYELFVYDAWGDGMCCSYGNGGYVLRTAAGDRIIDNSMDGDFTSTSTVGLPFCLAIGTDELTIATCDRDDLLPTSVIVTDENPAVSAQYGITDATSGYQFWFFDPDGSFNRRIFKSHANPGNGGGSGATKVCHMKLNEVNAPSIPTMTDLNVRVRGRIAGSYLEFGPACRMRIDATNAACPSTQLDGNPLHIGTTYSCGVTGKTVGASGYAGKVYANPVLSQPGNVVACKYRFVFTVPAEGFTRQITINSYALTLGPWAATPLLCGTFTYDVTVQASFDCTTYCPVGATCTVEITNPGGAIPCTAPFGGGGGSLNTMAADAGDLLIYPNPNNGEQLVLMMSELPADLEEVTMDIHDAFGRVVMSRTIAVGGGEMNHVLDLDRSLANGMYTVKLTAGEAVFTQRLVIE